MKWYKSIFNKDPDYEVKNNTNKMPKNIYQGKTYKQHYKKFHIVHYVFKYKFFVPLLLLARRILRKVMVKKVKKQSHNLNLYLFNKAFEEAHKKWHLYYLRNSGPMNKRRTKAQMLKRAKQEIYLTTMKELVNTLYIYDTAYREFLNMLFHEITLTMVKEYSRSNKYKDKKTNHLLFTTDIYEVNYFVLEKMMKYNIELKAINAESMLRGKNEQKPDISL